MEIFDRFFLSNPVDKHRGLKLNAFPLFGRDAFGIFPYMDPAFSASGNAGLPFSGYCCDCSMNIDVLEV